MVRSVHRNKYIVQSDSVKLKKSQMLKKVETLLYDFDFTGLDLSTWTVVTFHQKEFHCILQPLDGKGSGDLLHVHHHQYLDCA